MPRIESIRIGVAIRRRRFRTQLSVMQVVLHVFCIRQRPAGSVKPIAAVIHAAVQVLVSVAGAHDEYFDGAASRYMVRFTQQEIGEPVEMPLAVKIGDRRGRAELYLAGMTLRVAAM